MQVSESSGYFNKNIVNLWQSYNWTSFCREKMRYFSGYVICKGKNNSFHVFEGREFFRCFSNPFHPIQPPGSQPALQYPFQSALSLHHHIGSKALFLVMEDKTWALCPLFLWIIIDATVHCQICNASPYGSESPSFYWYWFP